MSMAGRNVASQGASILKRIFREFLDDECPRMAAAISYYTAFSLPPLLVLLILGVGVVLSPEQVQAWIQGQAGEMIGPDAARQIVAMVDSAQQRAQRGASGGVIFGIAGLLFGATGAFVQLQKSLNTTWSVAPDPERSALIRLALKRALSLAMILIIAFLMIASLIISSIISAISGELGHLLPGDISGAVIWLLNTGISLLVITVLLAAVFRVLPDASVAWRDIWLGAVVTALLFVLGKVLIGIYIGHTNPTEIYGAAATFALVLLWVYYSAMIVLLGAELTQVWSEHRGRGIRPAAGAVRVIRNGTRPDR